MTMQALIRCPNCGSTNIREIHTDKLICNNCLHQFTLKETEQ
jgi:uncharacterized Zn finger protein (UPF0148 family)